jgi:hypothetical protein
VLINSKDLGDLLEEFEKQKTMFTMVRRIHP